MGPVVRLVPDPLSSATSYPSHISTTKAATLTRRHKLITPYMNSSSQATSPLSLFYISSRRHFPTASLLPHSSPPLLSTDESTVCN
ncbi:hypothetical protein GDO78_009774 [Eleutherodactylus coqui]|uniref:Uncharacterized protein n=1 Tax=Eleutherodactylus coqui TaxID=57060 RepID=A0A8J6F9L8_ELECQ|nr:hypothetical protein GDO78_009774 [Eleutherodactylus coqui]